MTSDTNPITNTPGWKVRHSAWLLAVVLGVGSFSFIGFVYCAARVRSRTWRVRAVVATVISLSTLLVLALSSGSSAAGGLGALVWFASIGYGLSVNRDYLRWRAQKEPLPAPVAPVSAVLPPTLAPMAEAGPPVVAPMLGDATVEVEVADSQPDNLDAAAPHTDTEYTSADADADTAPVGTWQDAEALAAWHMRKLGFRDAETTPAGADGGIDVRAAEAVAQVKHYSNPVGAPAVQQLLGAAHGHTVAIFYALSGYTKAAIEFAEAGDVALFRFDGSGQVEPITASARTLQSLSGSPDGFDASEYRTHVAANRDFQRLFDESTAIFFASARRIVDEASTSPSQRDRSRLKHALSVEMEHVKRLIEPIGDRTVPSSQLRSIIEEILTATERLDRLS